MSVKLTYLIELIEHLLWCHLVFYKPNSWGITKLKVQKTCALFLYTVVLLGSLYFLCNFNKLFFFRFKLEVGVFVILVSYLHICKCLLFFSMFFFTIYCVTKFNILCTKPNIKLVMFLQLCSSHSANHSALSTWHMLEIDLIGYILLSNIFPLSHLLFDHLTLVAN